MNWLLGMIAGYLVHDALQPTAVGQVLDQIALPGDLFVKDESKETQQ